MKVLIIILLIVVLMVGCIQNDPLANDIITSTLVTPINSTTTTINLHNSPITWQDTCNIHGYGECANKETGLKKSVYKNISVYTQDEIICRWVDPDSNYKECEVIIEVENFNKEHDFIEKNAPYSKFKHTIKDMEVYTSKTYTLKSFQVLNESCAKEIERVKTEKEADISDCYYNVTKKVFTNWKKKTKLDKFPQGNSLGIKLEFKSPMTIEAGEYVINQFNFTLFGDYNITLDPDISACASLVTAGATYYLTANITDSSTTNCINITANHVTFDCQGYMLDGDDSADHGIYVYRPSVTNTSITIQNCMVTNWSTAGIFLQNVNNNTLRNLNVRSNSGDGIHLSNSNYSTITNVTANSNPGFSGIYLTASSFNNISNITANLNTRGIYIYIASSSNTLTGITTNSNSFCGIYSYSNSFNTFNDITISSNTWMGLYLYNTHSSIISNLIVSSNNNKGIEIDGNDNEVRDSIVSGHSGANDVGIYIDDDHNRLINLTLYSNYYGIQLDTTADNNTVVNCSIYGNSQAGIYMDGAGPTTPNLIYNNLLNNTNNIKFEVIHPNDWNVSIQTGKRVVSEGTQIAGNYWSNYTTAGYSINCIDSDTNGFCDIPLNISTDGTNRDYMPLSDEYPIIPPSVEDAVEIILQMHLRRRQT